MKHYVNELQVKNRMGNGQDLRKKKTGYSQQSDASKRKKAYKMEYNIFSLKLNKMDQPWEV